MSKTIKTQKETIFSEKVLAWFAVGGRKDLPWQQKICPYYIWLSEIMLQQTQVKTVIPYFERFISTFPTLEKLAAAPLDHILHLWTGLGYYTRARNLHKTAKIIVDNLGGEFPTEVSQLMNLPGIGRSTAGAICAAAFNQAATILDGNVKRVLSRYAGIDGWPGDKVIEKQLWQLAENFTPDQLCRNYNQAMMDLGALICTRTKPQCNLCPLQSDCIAYASGDPQQFPGKKTRKILPIKSGYMLLLQNLAGNILLEQRPALGLWGGLWCLPEFSGSLDELTIWCRQHYDLQVETIQLLSAFRHTFSHFHYDIQPCQILVTPLGALINEDKPTLWYDSQDPPKIGLSKPCQFLLKGNHHVLV